MLAQQAHPSVSEFPSGISSVTIQVPFFGQKPRVQSDPTPQDTSDKVALHSLATVGHVFVEALAELEKKLGYERR
jgi:hypothetical protein